MTAPHITVRMYKGLLGDCFLLRLFEPKDGLDRTQLADANILIDFGVLQRSPSEKDRIARVAKDIGESCNGRLDLVVITHEHHDHICGFGAARDLFLDGGIKIDHLWLAWTELSDDPQALRLRGLMDETRMAIQLGLTRMAMRVRQTPDQEWDLGGEALGLDGFMGPFAADGKERLTGREIIEQLKTQVKPAPEDYLEPGQVKITHGAVKLKTFVFGPPRNEERLFQDSPSRKGVQETYFAARQEEVRSTARNIGSCDSECGLDSMPFSKRHQQLMDKDVLDPNLAAPTQPSRPQQNLWNIRNLYLDEDEDWRRIDTDWQSAVGALALKLDSDTNNTSLVLAFEVEPEGEVMLFAADAQVGNWRSWHDQSYPVEAAPNDQVSAASLLARTTLYKVGHHGSHNATLAGKGLEMMTNEKLVALLPLVEEVATKRRWRMPASALYKRLLEKTEGRVLRGDAAPPPEMTQDDRFANRVREKDDPGSELGPLWVEFDVK